ncbi:MAG: Ca2+-dependent phosphoinositide-specific phospholipase C [Acidimicrobiia bacterium]
MVGSSEGRGSRLGRAVAGGLLAAAIAIGGSAGVARADDSARATESGVSDLGAPTAAYDALPLDQVTLLGSHNTYQKVSSGRDRTAQQVYQNAKENKFEYLFDALATSGMIELDIWPLSIYDGPRYYVKHDLPTPGSVNENNCPEQGRVDLGRHQDLRSCIEGLRRWHDQNPDHSLVIVKLELKPGFLLSGSPASLDDLIANVSGREPNGDRRLPRDVIFTPRDLMGCDRSNPANCRYSTPEAAVGAQGWPTMGSLRGKFLFTMIPGEVTSKGPNEIRPILEKLRENPVGSFLTGPIQQVLERVMAALPATDGPRVYAAALRRNEAQLIFPTPLLKAANGDPRPAYFADPADRPWAVSFDMEQGYLARGEVTAATVDWIHANRFLMFITAGTPAPACTSDACRRLWITRQADPAAACGDASRFAVDVAAGSGELAFIRYGYRPTGINTDQERQGLTFQGQYGGGSATATVLGGTIPGGVSAITWLDNRHDLFTRGMDGRLWQNINDPGACRGWSGWFPLGGAAFASDVSVAPWGNTALHLFARSGTNTLLHRWWDANGWSAWEDLGGSIVGAPVATAWAPGRLDVVARDGAGQLVIKSWDGSRWSAWSNLGLQGTSDPAIVSLGAGMLDVFVRDGNFRLAQLSYRSGRWSTPIDLGGYLISRPAVASSGATRLDVFVVGGDGRLWQRRWVGPQRNLVLPTPLGWTGWQPLGHAASPNLSAASWGADRSYVYDRRPSDGTVVAHWFPA